VGCSGSACPVENGVLTACQSMSRPSCSVARVGLRVHDEAVARAVTGEVRDLLRHLGGIFRKFAARRVWCVT
jgi:hypothetical protein